MKEETLQRKQEDKAAQQRLVELFTDMKDRGKEIQDMQKNQKQLGQEVCKQFKAMHEMMKNNKKLQYSYKK